MFRSYLKIALRHMSRKKIYAGINILGLAIGMACCAILFIYVYQEMTYDRYHRDGNRVYRVYEEIQTPTATRIYAPIAWPLAPALLENYPQAEAAVRVFGWGDARLVQEGERRFFESSVFFAEASLFDVLSFRFLQGRPDKALERPNTLVITRRMAEKYFGVEDPIGRTLTMNNYEYEITGVIENAPYNTHLKADFLASMKTIEDEGWMSNWHGTECYTYIKLQPGVDPAAFEEQIMRIGFEYVGDLWKARGKECFFHLQPISDIHLHSHLRNEIEPPGNLSTVLLMGGIGVLMLLVACINFVNLATARSIDRAREVGLRKVIGGLRRDLMLQFWGESFILVLMATLVSLLFIILALPFFNDLAGTSFGMKDLLRSSTGLLLTGIILFCGIGAGLYPSFQLSSFQPAALMRGFSQRGKRGSRLREIMVVFQFVISILLTIGTLTVFQQILFMKNQHPGFDRVQKLVIPVRGGVSIRENFTSVKNTLIQHPSISGASASSHVPGMQMNNFTISLVDEEDRKNQGMYHMYIDADFIPLYGIGMVAGRAFQSDRTTDFSDWERVGGFILNEAAVKAFRFHQPYEALGKRLNTGCGGREGMIIGVTKDFHYRGLQSAVEPLIMECFPARFQCLTLSLNTEKLDASIHHVTKTWEQFYPDVPLESYFLDAFFDREYRAEERLGKNVGVFTGMGLIIACLGLLGLASFTAEQRTKEIGIRKTVGAPTYRIVLMLSREYAKWVLAANIVAWPMAWFLMNRWLSSFATRTPIRLWIFILSGFAALVVAIVTVGAQSIKAALANPVKCLKYE